MSTHLHTRNRLVSFHLISLGCPKNLVDSEKMMASLALSGLVLVDDPELADVLIVNTCGFIKAAREESYSVILEQLAQKLRYPRQRVIVTGCMVQDNREELLARVPRVDAALDLSEQESISEVVRSLLDLPKNGEYRCVDSFPPRLLATPSHVAYLQISDGCFHQCSFCTIPRIRGKLRSRPMEEILAETRALVRGGARELVVIAQDTTSYGFDLYGEFRLVDLLKAMEDIKGLEWIRLMYTYPTLVDSRLIHHFGESRKLCAYIDLPVQHGDSEILSAMRRGSSLDHLTRTIDRLREARRGISIRTSVIVGFPGETEAHFENLMKFLERTRFDRVGVFPYSREEGTPSVDLPNEVPEEVIRERYEYLLDWAAEQALKRHKRQVGSVLRVLVDHEDTEDPRYFWGRWEGQAPDVDGRVRVQGRRLRPGRFVRVRITDADEDNLYGTRIESVRGKSKSEETE
ncbi:MAG TPA: 30S ribosomal protein S12 methylthiotransferase RimO [bacterium]|nr:30S ribosomal protein S12 methylthiotransferase RimO [bacterium]HQL62879.1 30S ribosomal protein S12 methylthiotransferase RimO [bacterium]